MKCRECGERIEGEMKNCPNCGAFVPQRIDLLASIAMVVALISILYNRYAIVSVIGIVLSIIAKKRLTGTRRVGRGIAIAALVISIITIVWLIAVTILDNYVFISK